jgi:hypothetical protein
MTYRLTTMMILFAFQASASADDSPLLGEAARKASPTLFADPEYRSAVLARAFDDYVAADPDEAGWVGLTSKDLDRAFRRIGADSAVRVDSHSVIPNPEPSSIAIWAALGCGLLAAAHGVRQRKSPGLAA